MEQVWLRDICKGLLCTLSRQKVTKSTYYYLQGDEATYESTKKHKDWNSVGFQS